jgi:hypothetical protein
MVLRNSKTRKMVKDVNHDAIRCIDKQIDRVQDWKSVGRREKGRVIRHLERAKQDLIDGHKDLMIFFLPTK